MITIDFDRLSLPPGARILDIGCGSGRHVCAASRLKGVTAIGADLRFENAQKAKEGLLLTERVGEGGGGVWATLLADMVSLPFQDESFDLVICSEVLEHIPEHRWAVTEAVRVLKKGGDLVVSVPRFLPERLCWALSRDYHLADGGHIRIYKKKELTALLEGRGVRKWASHFAHSLHSPYWWLKCLVGPTREDSAAVNLYHRFLVWDMMNPNPFVRLLEYLLNPLFGKSTVIYCRKE